MFVFKALEMQHQQQHTQKVNTFFLENKYLEFFRLNCYLYLYRLRKHLIAHPLY